MDAATADPLAYPAVADPHRRRMLDLLSERDRTVTKLVGAFAMSRPAVSQHLGVLRRPPAWPCPYRAAVPLRALLGRQLRPPGQVPRGARRWLTRKGVATANGIERAPWGRFVQVDDPDGNGIVPRESAAS